MSFADSNGERMCFIEKLGVIGWGIKREGVACKRNERLIAFVAARVQDQLMAVGDAAKVFVGQRDGVSESVKQDGIGRFPADTGESQKPAAKVCGWTGRKQFERASELVVHKGNKCFERRRLASVKAAGTNESLQMFKRDRTEPIEAQGSGGSKVGKRTFDGFPCGVLGEIGADHDFKGSLSGPPVLWAISPNKQIVHAAQALGRRSPGLHGRESRPGGDWSCAFHSRIRARAAAASARAI